MTISDYKVETMEQVDGEIEIKTKFLPASECQTICLHFTGEEKHFRPLDWREKVLFNLGDSFKAGHPYR